MTEVAYGRYEDYLPEIRDTYRKNTNRTSNPTNNKRTQTKRQPTKPKM
jgi:hypothetical protein